jgi:hypothetical protein
MFDSRNAADGGHEVFPALLLRMEYLAPLGGQAVIPAAPLVGFFHPLSLDPTLGFEAMEQRIERGDMEGEGAAGADLDQLRDVIAMTGPGFEKRENQKFGAAFFPFGIGREVVCSHIWAASI